VGKLLRRTGLDELPQLINVLKGEMSLIGPAYLAWKKLFTIKVAASPSFVKPGLSCFGR
jgi:lipopolysaccharide/colanic/teichoic acid biosynthesis glycosyltransferase